MFQRFQRTDLPPNFRLLTLAVATLLVSGVAMAQQDQETYLNQGPCIPAVTPDNTPTCAQVGNSGNSDYVPGEQQSVDSPYVGSVSQDEKGYYDETIRVEPDPRTNEMVPVDTKSPNEYD